MNRQNGQTDGPTVWLRHAIWRYMYVRSYIPFTHHISYNRMVFAGCLYKSI